MKVVEQSAVLLPQPTSPVEVLRRIEYCGRICYKSDDKITDDSYLKFLRGVVKRQHFAVLEHGNIIIGLGHRPTEVKEWFDDVCGQTTMTGTPLYLACTYSGKNGTICSGNIRAWRDFILFAFRIGMILPDALIKVLSRYAPLFDDIALHARSMGGTVQELSVSDLYTPDEIKAHQRETVLFTTDRGVTHEIVRHRPASYLQESTRYCNYGKGKFSKELTMIKPSNMPGFSERIWIDACEEAEKAYLRMLDCGATPQIARSVLPHSVKAELVMTANIGEWLHFVRLRALGQAGTPHPQMREVATQAMNALNCVLPEFGKWL